VDTRRYLHRIDADVAPEATPSHELLAKLQRRHLQTVPFENLDVVAGREIPIDRGAHYQKIVVAGRGGFCYELNGLFDWLLGELGFTTRFVEGQVNNGNGFSQRFAHAAVLVDLGAAGPPASLDGWYLADVGFGDFARQPLPLTGEPRTDVSGTYRVRQLDDGRFESQYRGPRPGEEAAGIDADQWVPRYRLTPADRAGEEFESMCEWTQTAPESAFTDRLICSIARPDGRWTLSENALTVTRGDEKTKQPVGPEERRAVLRARFDIEFDGPLRLPSEEEP
jgi:N-hydroxyarylamine O-acetyltransferase